MGDQAGDGARRLRLTVLCLAAFCSGAGSLIYQVVWIRKVTGVTSATATATAIVVGAFMAGLACGARLAGRQQPLLRRPLLAYAIVELAAAALAVASIPVIEASGTVLELPLLEQLGIHAIWIPYLAVVLFLMVPTTLLGMSLPLMIAHDERHERQAAYFVNLVYGTNTAGAVCGCLLAGFFTIELLGLRGSIFIGAALASLAALAVVPLFRRTVGAPATQAPEPVRIRGTYLLAAFACGWVALAAEIVWTRLVSLIVTNTVYAYTQVLVAVLIGITAGAYAGLLFCRWAGAQASRDKLVGLAICAMALGAILMAAVPHALTSPTVIVDATAFARGSSLRGILTLFLILVPPTAAVAFVLPVLALIASERQRFQSFGDLYALNTWGGVAGSLLAGLLLLPWLGLDLAMLLLVLAALLAAAILAIGYPRPLLPAAIIGPALVVVLGLSSGVRLPEDVYRLRIGPAGRLLDFRETAQSDAMVTEDAAGNRRLWINSNWVAGTGGGHFSLGHLPAMFLDRKERALGIGMGTGQTFAAILDMGVQALDCVEINRGVIELSEKWFSAANGDLTRRPGVRVIHDDGRAYLRTTSTTYDLIILEPLQAWSAGTTQLYTAEFYREASRRLAPGGVLAQWIPFYGQDAESTRSMVATALAVFPDATLWLDYMDGILILRQPPAPGSRAWSGIAAQFEQHVRSKGPMGRLATAADALALFQMGPAGLAAWTRGARLLTDDRPFLEFAAARGLEEDYFPETLESIQAFRDDPATYFERAGADDGTFARAALIREVVNASDLRQGSHREEAPRYAGSLRELDAGLARVPDSSLLQIRYKLGLVATLPGLTSTPRIEQLLLRTVQLIPDYGPAYAALAALYDSQNRWDEAQRMRARALEDPLVREGMRKGAAE
ncbi:MAG: fused MFS/spermidine synthase [Chromatiales bacterium]|nr:fused MFS/spermidine synthase [Chromatiales bacterium]